MANRVLSLPRSTERSGSAVADRMIVFVDWQNTYRGARRAFHGDGGPGPHGQVCPNEVGEIIAARTRPAGPRYLQEVRVYLGVPSKAQSEIGRAAKRAQTVAWDRHPKVEVFRHTLQRKPSTCPRCGSRRMSDTCQQCGHVRQLLGEKGVDVNMAIDLVSLAHEGAYDVGVVLSTDTDFNSAIKLAMRLGVQVENALWWKDVPHSNRPLLPSEIWHHKLHRRDYKRARDESDYVPGWARRPSGG